jgi:proteic killer suppression protein
VIQTFGNQGTEDIFDGIDSPSARRCCPKDIWSTARRKLDQVNRSVELHDLAVPPGNRLEHLKGGRAGQMSIRINEKYRICFRWEDNNAYEVEIADYH